MIAVNKAANFSPAVSRLTFWVLIRVDRESSRYPSMMSLMMHPYMKMPFSQSMNLEEHDLTSQYFTWQKERRLRQNIMARATRMKINTVPRLSTAFLES